MPEQAVAVEVTNTAQPITAVVSPATESERGGEAVVTPVGTATVEITPAAE